MKPGNRGKQRCQIQQVKTWQMRFDGWQPLLRKRFFVVRGSLPDKR